MNIDNVTFDDNTDYAEVVDLIKLRLSELISTACDSSCSLSSDRSILRIDKFLKAAAIDLADSDLPRYHEAVQDAYFEIRKLNC